MCLLVRLLNDQSMSQCPSRIRYLATLQGNKHNLINEQGRYAHSSTVAFMLIIDAGESRHLSK